MMPDWLSLVLGLITIGANLVIIFLSIKTVRDLERYYDQFK